MAEARSLQAVANLEPSVYAMAAQQARAEGKSLSAYARSCIIWDLVRKGRLDETKLAMLVTGDSEGEFKQLIAKLHANDNTVAQV